MDTDIQALGGRLVGAWYSEATHPEMPGTVVVGSAEFEWLERDRVLVQRASYDHPDIPDAVAIFDDVDGFRMYYFDARGVHRVYEISVFADGWVSSMDRNAPTHSYTSADAPFSQRMTYTFESGDQIMTGQGQLSYDDSTWNDDLAITYRRTTS